MVGLMAVKLADEKADLLVLQTVVSLADLMAASMVDLLVVSMAVSMADSMAVSMADQMASVLV